MMSAGGTRGVTLMPIVTTMPRRISVSMHTDPQPSQDGSSIRTTYASYGNTRSLDIDTSRMTLSVELLGK
eukprot:COSAG02_NODE_861_length_16429_cov_75.930680_6_plen_70_part_00